MYAEVELMNVTSFMFNAGVRSWRVGPTAQQFHSGPCGSLYLWNLENVARKKNTSLEYHTQQDYPFKVKDTQHRALTTLRSRQQKWRTNKDFLRLSQTSKNRELMTSRPCPTRNANHGQKLGNTDRKKSAGEGINKGEVTFSAFLFLINLNDNFLFRAIMVTMHWVFIMHS